MGIGEAAGDPQYNFLNQFLTDSDEDSISDTLFFNANLSPYQNVEINCSYIDTDDICQKNLTNKLSILSLNIQSLAAKFDNFNSFINQLSNNNSNPDVICLQETWDVKDSSLFDINNYHSLELNLRSSARGGGVGIYIKNSLTYNRLTQFSVCVDRILESLFVEVITPGNKKIIIGSIYRPGTKFPGLTFTEQYEQFSELLTNLLSSLGDYSDGVYIYGDLNLDILKLSENKFISNYIDTVFSFGFLQLVTNPTRIADNSATLIDHILTNSSSTKHQSFIICSDISDHFPILHHLDFNKPKNVTPPVETRNFSTANIKKFKIAMKSYNWDHVLAETSTQTGYTNFISTFTSLYDVFFPLRRTNFNRNFNSIEPWMTSGILTSRRQKNTLFKTSLRNPSAINKTIYKNYRNSYNHIIRHA